MALGALAALVGAAAASSGFYDEGPRSYEEADRLSKTHFAPMKMLKKAREANGDFDKFEQYEAKAQNRMPIFPPPKDSGSGSGSGPGDDDSDESGPGITGEIEPRAQPRKERDEWDWTTGEEEVEERAKPRAPRKWRKAERRQPAEWQITDEMFVRRSHTGKENLH